MKTCSRQLQIQERLTQEIADGVDSLTGAGQMQACPLTSYWQDVCSQPTTYLQRKSLYFQPFMTVMTLYHTSSCQTMLHSLLLWTMSEANLKYLSQVGMARLWHARRPTCAW